MIKLSYPVIVEGKYDKIKLSGIISSEIIVLGGFSIYKNKEKLNYIKKSAEKGKIIILTDSDGAGFKIRSFLKGAVPNEKIINVYVPEIYGKEKRKAHASAEGKLGVEGISEDIILESLKKAGALDENTPPAAEFPRSLMFSLGLSGGEGSAQLRREVLKALNLPQHLSLSDMCKTLPKFTTCEELTDLVKQLKEKVL